MEDTFAQRSPLDRGLYDPRFGLKVTLSDLFSAILPLNGIKFNRYYLGACHKPVMNKLFFKIEVDRSKLHDSGDVLIRVLMYALFSQLLSVLFQSPIRLPEPATAASCHFPHPGSRTRSDRQQIWQAAISP